MELKTTPATIDQVADLLARVAAANGLVTADGDRISSCWVTVSRSTLERVTSFTAELRPDAKARAMLAELDPGLLLAGTSVWLARRRGAVACHSAAARVATRWCALKWVGDRVAECEVGG